MKTILWIMAMLIAFSTTSIAQAEDVINVAAIYALSGLATEAHAGPVNGVKWAVDEINAAGGLIGRKINLILIDNLSTPIGSSVAAEKAEKENAVAIIGSAWSSHSISIAKVAQNFGIPMISCQSTNPEVTLIGSYIFRVCFTDRFQGEVMAQFARQHLKATTAIVFTKLDDDYSTGLSEIFIRNFKLLNGVMIKEIEYKSNVQNLDGQIAAARKANADVAFFTGHDETGHIAKLMQNNGIRSIPLGGDGWIVDSFFTKGGNQLKRGYFCSHWSADSTENYSRQFVRRYRQREGFGVGSALSYDAMMVLAHAIRSAGVTDRIQVRNALAHTRNFQGVTGKISFNADGDPVKSAVIMEIKNGRAYYLQTLSPEQ